MTTILATGAYLKNAAGLLRGERYDASPEHGDLGTPEACRALEESAERLLALAQGRVDALAHDLHPDFHSTRVALALAERLGVPAVAVQHHHAHIAVVLAEQRCERAVIGLALDGVGLGSDGSAWGGELLWVQGSRWRRVGHLATLALPGGDRAAREPWRMAAAALAAMGRGDEIEARFAAQVGAPLARGVADMLQRGLNCPPTSSAGRWFDAAAGALGLSVRQAHEAEAAIRLERLAVQQLHEAPVKPMRLAVNQGVIDPRPLLARLFELGAAGAVGEGALLFHHSLADALAGEAARAASVADTDLVILGGGCFVNRVLGERVRCRLLEAGLRVQHPRSVSCGDSGLALGQAWVAAKALARGRHHAEEISACA